MEPFGKNVNSYKLLTIFAKKSPVTDALQYPKYASAWYIVYFIENKEKIHGRIKLSFVCLEIS